MDKPTTVLMIDDDATLASFLARFAVKYNYRVLHAGNAKDGLKEIERVKPAAVLLDVNLPGASGLDICREIRNRSAVPIIMISALGETSDRIVGLQAGADGYLPKPFEPRELVAQLDALLRRAQVLSARKTDPIVTVGRLRVDLSRREVFLGDDTVDLSSAEFDLLAVFVSKPGHVFDRDELLNRLKGVDWDACNRSIDILVSRLRKKLGDGARQAKLLKTVRGAGYMLVPSIDQKGRKAG